MHVLVVGSGGQLGSALVAHLRQDPAVSAVSLWDRPEIDITQPVVSDQLVALAPDVVINAAAWTDVDGAERNPDLAYAANAVGPLFLAQGCRRAGARLVQISTNEVFLGESGTIYREFDQPGPVSVYARSKLAGEEAVRQVASRWMIVRVAWLFGPGGVNFPTKIVAAADKHGSLRVVDDEFGNPTYAPDAARAIAALIATDRDGAYHLVNAGYTSRYELAATVLHHAGRGDVPLTPIHADDWPRPSQPPRHAVLANQTAAALGIVLRPWQEAAAEYAATLAPMPQDQAAG